MDTVVFNPAALNQVALVTMDKPQSDRNIFLELLKYRSPSYRFSIHVFSSFITQELTDI